MLTHIQINLMTQGGLDCRYMISQLQPEKFIPISLTTIATPHRGSSFVDWCRDSLGVANKTQNATPARISDVIHTLKMGNPNVIHSLLSPFDAPAFHDLTTDFCRRVFNEQTPDSPLVHYASYAAVEDVPVTGALYFSHQIVKKAEGPNDGLVSLSSATWGDFWGVLDCDHWDLVPRKVSFVSLF